MHIHDNIINIAEFQVDFVVASAFLCVGRLFEQHAKFIEVIENDFFWKVDESTVWIFKLSIEVDRNIFS